MRAPLKAPLAVCAAVGAALLIALTGCSASSEPTPAASAAASQPETTAPPECSGLTGLDALSTWAGEVASDRPWDVAGEYSDVAGYDECAELSWIVLRPEACCTAFEITPVMFFHRGEYIADATVADRAVDRTTEPERIADGEVALTFAAQSASASPVLTKTTFRWDEVEGAVIVTEPQPQAGPSGAGPDGRWCPTPESGVPDGCVTITLPTASYDSGAVEQLVDAGDTSGDGGTNFIGDGAPFGTYYPPGTPIVLPDYYPGADIPDQDRIWNGQTGVMLVRA
ncbi:LppP/LprE family lipoprotein [Agreia sp. Leaf210]|uniref:LppP/LprE family lipoprotein n=1 Tax=Agreia sp. Leaf210 TaxID=1735682 RepID=UPI0006FEAEB5|nr:LppP/LprE family lipoprotein [Agreia sp. Leaf210]KQM57533.1 hypothetical protein ASE64_15350 [Agreia sp. Leaf210]